MSKPLVSIALATYNGERFVEEQIQSLLAQDYPNLEIVISDDCSQDSTWQILKRYAQLDTRIRLLPRDKNVGYVKNFLRVFEECKGELISSCDQDDIWYSNKTSRLVEEIGDATLIYCNNRFIDEDNRSLGITFADKVKMISGSDSRQLMLCNTICGHTMLFKKELLSVTDQLDIAPYIDWLIAFLAAEHGSIFYLDEVLVDWRQHNKSTTFHVRQNVQGAKRKALMTDRQILEAFSKVSIKHRFFLIDILKRWDKWFYSYLDLRMFLFVLKHQRTTHVAHPAKFPALKYLLGYKLKKFLRPNHY